MSNYKTDNNLHEAFAGESKANRRYMFFAEKAEKEGYSGVARLFRAVAEAETVHARNHLNALDAIGGTKENLMAAAIGEHQEFTGMYPVFVEVAQEERNDRAERTFRLAEAVEKIHHGLFESALEDVKKGEKPGESAYYVCQVCGNTVAGAPPEKCPVCGAPAKSFKRIE
ncbi:MAG TPA: rubrerythrin family protein [Dehalococcoidales bacterium]|nr:rubrerythrin family protein [Dehalococcoidales bacterium]